MNQTTGRGQIRYDPKSPSKTPVTKGLFSDGIWKCNCNPRLPAEHIQTKNGGPNHGRWFYVCQKPQPTRCKFWLWDNEAKAREARAVLSNSHTEPITATTTDKLSSSKPSVRSESSITPCSGSKTAARPNSQVAARNSAYQDTSKRDDEWLYVSDNDVDDQQLLDLIDRETMQPPDTPSKSIKRNAASSPGKRPHEEFQERSKGRPIYGKPTADIELFNTSNEIRGRGIFSAVRSVPQPRGTGKVGGLISPEITPAAIRVGPPHNHQDSSEGSLVMRDDTPAARTSSIIEYPDLDSDLLTPKKSVEKESYMTPLAQQILDALHSENTKMTDKIVRSVKTISVKHVIKTNQALKGLEWCREMIKKQKIQIVDLEAEIAKLKQGPSAKR